ncbi:hypothetical protein [Engelhardtia mirabilis]|uniref:hypothetical protein n=1 Tax=Engelhardtia mirabilis TaxID=2528011 RepID=UPI003AF35BF2
MASSSQPESFVLQSMNHAPWLAVMFAWISCAAAAARIARLLKSFAQSCAGARSSIQAVPVLPVRSSTSWP